MHVTGRVHDLEHGFVGFVATTFIGFYSPNQRGQVQSIKTEEIEMLYMMIGGTTCGSESLFHSE
jgi:hypothetical protein